MAISSRKFITKDVVEQPEHTLRWWYISQNNSGGHFYVDDNVAHYVLVQAYSSGEAERKLNDITDETASDWCPCCGERWYVDLSYEEGTAEPTIYGKPLEDPTAGWFGDEARLHYADGSVEAIVFSKEKS